MDRFIGAILIASAFFLAPLKSNMDRFIAYRSMMTEGKMKVFKIQYG